MNRRLALPILTALMALALFAPAATAQRRERVSKEGRITSVDRRSDHYRVSLADAAYDFRVPLDLVDHAPHEGDFVRIDGYINRDRVYADNFVWLRDRNEGRRYGRRSERDDENRILGVVESFNQRLNYFTVRDQRGAFVKIDTRRMDTHNSVNVWRLHAGDRIRVTGEWENRDTFQADRVNYADR